MHAKDLLKRAAVTYCGSWGFRILDRDRRCANGTFCPEPGALRPLDRAMELGRVGARGAHKIVRVAWSVADLAGQPRARADQIKTAIALCLGVSA